MTRFIGKAEDSPPTMLLIPSMTSVEVNYVIFLNNCLVTYILEFRFAYHCATIKFRSSIVIDT